MSNIFDDLPREILMEFEFAAGRSMIFSAVTIRGRVSFEIGIKNERQQATWRYIIEPSRLHILEEALFLYRARIKDGPSCPP